MVQRTNEISEKSALKEDQVKPGPLMQKQPMQRQDGPTKDSKYDEHSTKKNKKSKKKNKKQKENLLNYADDCVEADKGAVVDDSKSKNSDKENTSNEATVKDNEEDDGFTINTIGEFADESAKPLKNLSTSFEFQRKHFHASK